MRRSADVDSGRSSTRSDPTARAVWAPVSPPEAPAPGLVVAATSANLHGGPDPRGLDEVPRELLDAVGAVLDAGQLPGAPSTVVDLTGPEPRVLREGAVPAAEALARIAE